MTNALIELSGALAAAVEGTGSHVVSVNEGGRSGVSGTIWRDDLVVAAEHTIRDRQEVTIGLPGGNSLGATVVGRDPATDLVLLKPSGSLASHIEFADDAQLRVGQFLLAVGRRPERGVVASHGILSAIGGAWRTWHGARIDRSLRLDLLPFTGFSGGPLVDARGQVIGINTSGPRRSVLTIPVSTVNRVVEQLLEKGRIARGYMGVALQPVELPAAIRAQAVSGAGRGLLVVMVESDSPAEKAGLTVGDIVVALGEEPLSSPADLQEALDPEQIGRPVRLRVIHGGELRDLSILVAERGE